MLTNLEAMSFVMRVHPISTYNLQISGYQAEVIGIVNRPRTQLMESKMWTYPMYVQIPSYSFCIARMLHDGIFSFLVEDVGFLHKLHLPIH